MSPWRRQAPDERGAGSVLVGCLGLVLCAACLAGVWIAGWIGCLHAARSAADLAALAGAQAQVSGRDVCAATKEVAARNGAQLTRCRVEGDRRDFVVRVTVQVELRPRVGDRDRHVEQGAVAGSQPVR